MKAAACLLVLFPAAEPATPPQPVTIVSHRGLAEGMPENTLAAFRQSIELGVQIIELDLRVTKDGQMVVIHDDSLDRTTDCAGPVAAIELAMIRACNAGGGERVPGFAEVLALVRGKPVRVLADVKDGTPLSPVMAAIREHRTERQVILGLRSTRHVARARSALPQTTVLAYIPTLDEAQAFAAAGAHIIRLWSDWADADPAMISRTRALGPQVWIMVGRTLPAKKRDWRNLHSRMIAAGAQGLITDRPELISTP